MTTKTFQFFKTGAHKASNGEQITFSQEDLMRAAITYSPDVRAAPLVYGHPNDDKPVMGAVRRVFLKDNAMFAEASFSDLLVKEVKDRRFLGVSAKWYRPFEPANPRPGAWYLRHIGFLQTVNPAVKGMDPVAFAAQSASMPQLQSIEPLVAAFCESSGVGIEAMFSELPPSGDDRERERLVHHKMAELLMAADPKVSYAHAAGLAYEAIREYRGRAEAAKGMDPSRLAFHEAAVKLRNEDPTLTYFGAVQVLMRKQPNLSAPGRTRL